MAMATVGRYRSSLTAAVGSINCQPERLAAQGSSCLHG